MVFLRTKIVKGESYSYLVKSKWDGERKTSIQETVKYLGKTSEVSSGDVPFEFRFKPTVVAFLSNTKRFDGKVNQKHITKTRQNTLKFLLAGDLSGLRSIYKNFRKTSSIGDFYEKILQYTMYEIGALWKNGKLEIGAEHVASNTTMRLIESINVRLRPKDKAKTILICTPNGEFHAIPCMILETYLSLSGYKIINLSPSAPTKSIKKYVEEKKPDLILISITLKDNVSAGKRLITDLKNYKTPMLLGGQAIENMSSKLSSFDKQNNLKIIKKCSLKQLTKIVKQELI